MKKKGSMKRTKIDMALARMTLMQWKNGITREASKSVLLLAMMVLHDKFGFREKGLNKFLDEFNKQLAACDEGCVKSVKDFESVPSDEHGAKPDARIPGKESMHENYFDEDEIWRWREGNEQDCKEQI